MTVWTWNACWKRTSSVGDACHICLYRWVSKGIYHCRKNFRGWPQPECQGTIYKSLSFPLDSQQMPVLYMDWHHSICILEVCFGHEGMGACHRCFFFYRWVTKGTELWFDAIVHSLSPWTDRPTIRHHFYGWPGWRILGITPNGLVCRPLMFSGSGTCTIRATVCLDWRNSSTTSGFFDAEHMFLWADLQECFI